MLIESIQTPVIHECDLCVIGGSCTGLFAAIRAARLGLSVAIVEMQNCFGGVATSSMVNIWHSLLDTEYRQTIIGGLTVEVVERLQRRQAYAQSRRTTAQPYLQLRGAQDRPRRDRPGASAKDLLPHPVRRSLAGEWRAEGRDRGKQVGARSHSRPLLY